MGILILFISFSKLKPPVFFSTSLFEACASIVYVFLVCVSLVSTIFVRATCFSIRGLVTTSSLSLFLDRIFLGGTLVVLVSLGLKLYFC
jgi:hypothetical protein